MILGKYTPRGSSNEKETTAKFSIEYYSGYYDDDNMEKMGLLKIKCRYRIFTDGTRF